MATTVSCEDRPAIENPMAVRICTPARAIADAHVIFDAIMSMVR
jgi:hypothetical protein